MEKKDFDDFFDNLSEQLKDNSLFKFHEEIADIIIADREDAWEEIVKAFHKHTGFTDDTLVLGSMIGEQTSHFLNGIFIYDKSFATCKNKYI